MTTFDAFRAKLDALGAREIIGIIDATWDLDEGYEVREAGFDILWDRIGEDGSDLVYEDIYHKHHDPLWADRLEHAAKHIYWGMTYDEVRELYRMRKHRALSWYELALHYGITESEARRACAFARKSC